MYNPTILKIFIPHPYLNCAPTGEAGARFTSNTKRNGRWIRRGWAGREWEKRGNRKDWKSTARVWEATTRLAPLGAEATEQARPGIGLCPTLRADRCDRPIGRPDAKPCEDQD